MKNLPIGTKFSPILAEIEDALWDFEYYCPNVKPEYTAVGFRAAIKIFMSAFLDKMYEYQQAKLLSQEEKNVMAVEVGQAVRDLVKKYIGVDTKVLYKI